MISVFDNKVLGLIGIGLGLNWFCHWAKFKGTNFCIIYKLGFVCWAVKFKGRNLEHFDYFLVIYLVVGLNYSGILFRSRFCLSFIISRL